MFRPVTASVLGLLLVSGCGNDSPLAATPDASVAHDLETTALPTSDAASGPLPVSSDGASAVTSTVQSSAGAPVSSEPPSFQDAAPPIPSQRDTGSDAPSSTSNVLDAGLPQPGSDTGVANTSTQAPPLDSNGDASSAPLDVDASSGEPATLADASSATASTAATQVAPEPTPAASSAPPITPTMSPTGYPLDDATTDADAPDSGMLDSGSMDGGPSDASVPAVPAASDASVPAASDAGSAPSDAGSALSDAGTRCDPDGPNVGNSGATTPVAEPARILVGATGVGFSSSPARSVLHRCVKVFNATGINSVPWHAQSDQPWLTVGDAGHTGGSVELSANPTGLALGMHYATVTVTSPDVSVENTEAIRVGLYVLASGQVTSSIGMVAQSLAASPVDPEVFIGSGGTDVGVYNVYTGTLERTLHNVSAHAGAIVSSGDGRHLYVYDMNNLVVREVDSQTGTLSRTFSSSGSAVGAVGYLRPAAHPTLVVPSGTVFDLESGNPYVGLVFPGASYSASMMASEDSTLVAESTSVAISVRWSALTTPRLSATYVGSGMGQGAEGQACITEDGGTLYTASGAPYQFSGVDTTDFLLSRVLPGSPYPNSMVCAWNGLVIGGINGYYDATDIWVYDGPSGIELERLSSSTATGYRSLANRGMVVSADGARLITLSNTLVGPAPNSEVHFQSLAAPL